jgi:hypothetical protein
MEGVSSIRQQDHYIISQLPETPGNTLGISSVFSGRSSSGVYGQLFASAGELRSQHHNARKMDANRRQPIMQRWKAVVHESLAWASGDVGMLTPVRKSSTWRHGCASGNLQIRHCMAWYC